MKRCLSSCLDLGDQLQIWNLSSLRLSGSLTSPLAHAPIRLSPGSPRCPAGTPTKFAGSSSRSLTLFTTCLGASVSPHSGVHTPQQASQRTDDPWKRQCESRKWPRNTRVLGAQTMVWVAHLPWGKHALGPMDSCPWERGAAPDGQNGVPRVPAQGPGSWSGHAALLQPKQRTGSVEEDAPEGRALFAQAESSGLGFRRGSEDLSLLWASRGQLAPLCPRIPCRDRAAVRRAPLMTPFGFHSGPGWSNLSPHPILQMRRQSSQGWQGLVRTGFAQIPGLSQGHVTGQTQETCESRAPFSAPVLRGVASPASVQYGPLSTGVPTCYDSSDGPQVLHRMQFPAPSEYARLTCLLRP